MLNAFRVEPDIFLEIISLFSTFLHFLRSKLIWTARIQDSVSTSLYKYLFKDIAMMRYAKKKPANTASSISGII